MKTLALTTAGAFLFAGSIIGTANMQIGTTNQVSAKTMSQVYHKSSINVGDYKLVEGNTHKTQADQGKNGQQDQNKLEENNSRGKTEIDSDFLEHDILDEYVSSDAYQTQIVENNEHKRIIVLNDEGGQPQYKSIFVKETKSLEIIDLDQGMVFKGSIG